MRLFAIARDIVGRGELWVELPEGSTAADLFEHLEGQFPRLKELRGSLVFSINREYGNPEQPLTKGDEVALIPPVSGGVGV
ncbi:MAG: MoaD/ThiS family protein [Candidatus Methylomirabilales bacterium]